MIELKRLHIYVWLVIWLGWHCLGKKGPDLHINSCFDICFCLIWCPWESCFPCQNLQFSVCYIWLLFHYYFWENLLFDYLQFVTIDKGSTVYFCTISCFSQTRPKLWPWFWQAKFHCFVIVDEGVHIFDRNKQNYVRLKTMKVLLFAHSNWNQPKQHWFWHVKFLSQFYSLICRWFVIYWTEMKIWLWNTRILVTRCTFGAHFIPSNVS
jgi:hypothetical protein